MASRPIKASPEVCPEKASLRERTLMSYAQAGQVEALFEVLANDTRLRILHEVARREEVCVVDLSAALEMKSQAVSNQLARLQDKGIVASRRQGNNAYYRIVDNCVLILLERGLCLVEETNKRAERPPPSPT